MESKLTSFVTDSIRFVLKSYDFPDELESQIPYLTLIEKEHTTIGCCYSFDLSTESKSLISPNDNSILTGGCMVYVDSIGMEADLTIWVKNGKIDCLEVLSHTCNFPKKDPEKYYFKNTPVNYIDLT